MNSQICYSNKKKQKKHGELCFYAKEHNVSLRNAKITLQLLMVIKLVTVQSFRLITIKSCNVIRLALPCKTFGELLFGKLKFGTCLIRIA